jgi:DNA-binding HxlR family transcriptional regulator
MSKKIVACPVETAIEIIGGRWKVLILQELFGGTRRFSELHRALRGVSHRTLTQQLRELEAHGILRRMVHRQVPPKVEYSLTPVGETLKPVITVMHDWAESYSRWRMSKAKTRE